MKGKSLFVTIFLMLFLFASLVSGVNAENEVFGIDFLPERDGYNFANNYGSRFSSTEFTATSMIHLFGVDQVCQPGTLDMKNNKLFCTLTTPAEQYRKSWVEYMKNGHCHGMSVTALRSFLSTNSATRQPWANRISMTFGSTNSGLSQSAGKNTYDLKLGEDLAEYIAYYNSIATLGEEVAFRGESSQMKSTEIIALLIESFKNKQEFYTLTIGLKDPKSNKFELLHTVVPFKVTRMEATGNTMISVYDPNYPKETQFLSFNKTGQWIYRNGDKKLGDNSILSLSKISDHFHANPARNFYYRCPFGIPVRGHQNSEGSTDDLEKISFLFTGAGDLLITDPNGQKIGYDTQTKKEVNQVSEAEVLYQDSGLDLSFSPQYVLPYEAQAKESYQVLLSGDDLEKESKATLSVTAPGFVVGFENISLDPQEELTVSISPDGQTLSFTASEDGETPTLFITTADGKDTPSYSFKIGGVEIEEGKTLTLTIDIEEGKVYFKDDDDNEDAYDLEFEKLNPDGTHAKFAKKDVKSAGEDSYQVDISNWDKETEPCLKDEEGNNLDEDCENEDKARNEEQRR